MTLHPTVLRDLAADRRTELHAQSRHAAAVSAVRAPARRRHGTLRARTSAALSGALLHVGWSMVEAGLRLRRPGRMPRAARG